MRFTSGPGRRPDPSAARETYRNRAGRYDLELAAFEPLREKAIALLAPVAGDTVVDIGCGTGLSFPPLLERIGPTGRIVGVDPSPEMLELARGRVASHGWSNVAVLQATAAEAPLQGHADAALFHFTHDVIREPASLDNVLGHLKHGARVVASGLQWAPSWMLPTNLFVLGAALYSTSTLDGLDEPWTLLARRLKSFRVENFSWAGMYIATGLVG